MGVKLYSALAYLIDDSWNVVVEVKFVCAFLFHIEMEETKRRSVGFIFFPSRLQIDMTMSKNRVAQELWT